MNMLRKVINNHPRLKSMIRPAYNQIMKLRRGKVENVGNIVPQVFLSNKKVIYFDITSHSVSDVKTGIQRVVNKFLEYLDEITGENYEVVCISGLGGYHIIEKNGYQPRYDLVLAPKEGDIYLSIDFNPVQPYEYWDTLKGWQENGCKLLACVYDLVYMKYPEYVANKSAVSLLSRWLVHATANFDGLICISKTVEDELHQWMKDNNVVNEKLKTGYFHLGGDFVKKAPIMQDSTSAFFQRMCDGKPLTFLSVATIEPRKGYEDIVSAFEEVAKSGKNANLIIVGRIGWKYEDIVKKIVSSQYYNKSLFWFSDCEDNVLEILYQVSNCYISGSHYEGFGLGIIEASSKGLPVLLRDIPINREVSEEKGVYYKDVAELVTIIEKATENPDVLCKQERINSLSWKESVVMSWNTIQQMI